MRAQQNMAPCGESRIPQASCGAEVKNLFHSSNRLPLKASVYIHHLCLFIVIFIDNHYHCIIMAPKKPAQAKSKGGDGEKSDAKKGKEKAGTGTSVKVRHILCTKQSKALEAIARLNNGDKFNVVAQEMSEDKAKSGGDLGWQVRGQMGKCNIHLIYSARLYKKQQLPHLVMIHQQ